MALPSQEPALQVVDVEHKADKPKHAGKGHKK